jgi:Protein of unknown function (DUF2889)
MPLSPPDPREHCHTRQFELSGYRRADGLWDIEGHLVDAKPYEFPREDGSLRPPHDAIHDMWVRLTLDDDMVIRGCEAAMGAHPFPICCQSAPNFERLVGIRIGKGWMAEVNRRVGGVEGCTHLREMLPQMATTAFQAMYGAKMKESRDAGLGRPKPNPGRPRHLNACLAFREDGEIVKEVFPDYYTGRR